MKESYFQLPKPNAVYSSLIPLVRSYLSSCLLGNPMFTTLKIQTQNLPIACALSCSSLVQATVLSPGWWQKPPSYPLAPPCSHQHWVGCKLGHASHLAQWPAIAPYLFQHKNQHQHITVVTKPLDGQTPLSDHTCCYSLPVTHSSMVTSSPGVSSAWKPT